ncbi:MAG: DUF4230 domain-containing protein [Cyanobacteria bacterium J06623_7]
MKIFSSRLTLRQQLLLWSFGGVNLIIVMFIFALWRTGDRILDFTSSLFRRSTPITIETSAPLMMRIRGIQELSTTVQTLETIVPASAERKLGELSLGTTKLLYLARGEIRAGVDLAELTESDIHVTNNRIEINLPAAKILGSKIDVNNSRVYDYDRGFLNLGPDIAPQLQTLAQRKTLVEIVNTACSEEILGRANVKAQAAITQLLTNTSQQKIVVKTTEPEDCKITE